MSRARIALAVLLVIGLALLAGGIWLIVQRETGTRARATVSSCITTGSGKYESIDCSGSWVVGGSLLHGGHVVVGDVSGADYGDIGKTLNVTLDGDTAYVRAWTTPLVILGMGVVTSAGGGFLMFALGRKRSPRNAEASPGVPQ